ncbi:MAG: protein-disulfide isomerase [Microgenomates group bacterium Gr01-1014_5]|nr:MAG: protein-disulfide isomerase [Microgenomates group bacterium Gr01-1014_5]
METEQTQQKESQELGTLLRLSGILFAILIIVGALIWGLGQFLNNSSTETSTSSVNTISVSDQIKGNREAKVVLVEYSDFQCPACAAYYSVLKQVAADFKSDVAFVYRHFPLRQIHQNSELAARAAEAAGKQGKFWEMHDLLFENQKEWSSEKKAEEFFKRYAESLSLNTVQFETDINSSEIRVKVNNDYQSGVGFRVNATPTFFLNGEKLQNPRTYDEFKSLLQKAISK